MNFDLLTVTNLLLGAIGWVAMRVIKRVDKIEERIENHETRISIAEKDIEYTHTKPFTGEMRH